MDFNTAKAMKAILNKRVDDLSAALQVFPVGPMNLVTAEAKASPEYKIAKGDFDIAFTNLRAFNSFFTKSFAKEARAEREAKRTSWRAAPSEVPSNEGAGS